MNSPTAPANPAPSTAPTASNTQAPPAYRPWLHAYALLVVMLMFLLVAVGGTVTSRGVGLAVPDGWWTFDYFTLWAPPEVWWHEMGTRWEHSHRLKGYLVGMLTIGLAIWLWRSQRGRRWLQWAGVGLLALVCVQGVMGAARVDQISTNLAIIHGVTGQIILGLTVLIAAATSRVWLNITHARATTTATTATTATAGDGAAALIPRRLAYMAIALIILLVGQLVLGALIRHSGAALAIPDFPTAYGSVLPPLNQPDLDQAIAGFPAALAPYTVGEVVLNLSHRIGALVVLTAALWLVVDLNLRAPGRAETKWPMRWLMLLLGAQIALGAMVIWSGRYPEIATAHQAVGAAILAVAVWLTIRLHLLLRLASAAGSGSHGSQDHPQEPSAASTAESSFNGDTKEQPA